MKKKDVKNNPQVFRSEELCNLEAEWANFRMDIRGHDKIDYEQLMVKTFPILYKNWLNGNKTISKDIAVLMCTMGDVFAQCYDLDWQYIGPDCFFVADAFHSAFRFTLFIEGSLRLNQDGIIHIETNEYVWDVDSKTFELPDDIPWTNED